MKIQNGKDAVSVISPHTKFAKSRPQLIHHLLIWHELYLQKSKLPQVSVKPLQIRWFLKKITVYYCFFILVFSSAFSCSLKKEDGNPAIDLCVRRTGFGTARVKNKSWKGQRTSTVKGFLSNLNLYKKKIPQRFHAFSVRELKWGHRWS